jgi:serine/threonine protein kinase
VHATGIVHRDLKPENVMLRKSGAPVLVDFGIAIVGEPRTGVRVAGTRTYMAPEQARGRRVDARADLYALGVIAHELLLSAPPEAPSTSLLAALSRRTQRRVRDRLVAAGIELAVADLVARLLARHPRRRPKAAALVGQIFAQAAERAAGRS